MHLAIKTTGLLTTRDNAKSLHGCSPPTPEVADSIIGYSISLGYHSWILSIGFMADRPVAADRFTASPHGTPPHSRSGQQP